MPKRLAKEVKKYYERELRQYWSNKNKLKYLDKLNTRTVIFLTERIASIETVINSLDDFEKEVFYLIFKNNASWSYCKNIKNISKTTYYNIFNKCIYMLAEEIGEI